MKAVRLTITIYDRNETTFTHNGYGVLLASKAEITEELNGMYELELECSVDCGNRTWQYLDEEMIIKAPAPEGEQLFRIYAVNRTLDRRITINARHIFYDGLYNNIDADITDGRVDNVLNDIYRKLNYPLNFSVSSNIEKHIAFDGERKDRNPVDMIMGSGGVMELAGGELFRDNFNIQLLTSIGENRGFQVRYGKNMSGLDYLTDIEETVTRLYPVGGMVNGNALTLPEKYVDSPNINTQMPLIGRVEFNEITTEGGLRQAAHQFFMDGGDQPKISAKVNFVLLRKTQEYENYAFLEDIRLGDTVSVLHDELGISALTRCKKYVYDSIKEKYIEIELGQLRDDITANVGNLDRNVTNIESQQIVAVGNMAQMMEDMAKIKADIDVLKEKFGSHAHTGADGTGQINYNDLVNRP